MVSKEKCFHEDWEGKKKWECLEEGCNVRSISQDNLFIHYRRHTPYAFFCEHCNNGYSTKQKLTLHLRSHDPSKAVVKKEEPKQEPNNDNHSINTTSTATVSVKTDVEMADADDHSESSSSPPMIRIQRLPTPKIEMNPVAANQPLIIPNDGMVSSHSSLISSVNQTINAPQNSSSTAMMPTQSQSNVPIFAHFQSAPTPLMAPMTAYPCDRCPQHFQTKIALVEHRRSHTSDKPYVCEYCNKGFAKKENLMSHSRIHSGEKPFECPQCNKRFSKKDIFTSHLQTHTTTIPHRRRTHQKGQRIP